MQKLHGQEYLNISLCMKLKRYEYRFGQQVLSLEKNKNDVYINNKMHVFRRVSRNASQNTLFMMTIIPYFSSQENHHEIFFPSVKFWNCHIRLYLP